MEIKQRYWIAVVSKDHTLRGIAGGFMQANHGKQAPLQRMKLNDWVIFYSPKQAMESNLECKAFTAIGQICDKNIYQHAMSEHFIPFRRNVKFYHCNEVSILPLIEGLEFIKNKKSWGYPFRFGFFEIGENDFNLISKNMLKDGG
ncbi:MAG: EVE domain-containing protein [Segetibacter sp.]